MTSQKRRARSERVKKMIATLKKIYPHPAIALRYTSPWELVVAVILSAQTTDVQVNKVTATLFKKYPTLSDYVRAKPSVFAKDVSSVNLYKTKAKNILALAKIIARDFDGTIPRSGETLVTLPGIGRKTANVIVNELYHEPMGITVDTHIRRFAIRFDLSDFTDPTRIEKDLMEIVPKKEWATFSHRLITYGREYCPAQKHECSSHPLTAYYPKAATRWPKAK